MSEEIEVNMEAFIYHFSELGMEIDTCKERTHRRMLFEELGGILTAAIRIMWPLLNAEN